MSKKKSSTELIPLNLRVKVDDLKFTDKPDAQTVYENIVASLLEASVASSFGDVMPPKDRRINHRIMSVLVDSGKFKASLTVKETAWLRDRWNTRKLKPSSGPLRILEARLDEILGKED
jgi:hypothetical protein